MQTGDKRGWVQVWGRPLPATCCELSHGSSLPTFLSYCGDKWDNIKYLTKSRGFFRNHWKQHHVCTEVWLLYPKLNKSGLIKYRTRSNLGLHWWHSTVEGDIDFFMFCQLWWTVSVLWSEVAAQILLPCLPLQNGKKGPCSSAWRHDSEVAPMTFFLSPFGLL